MTYHDFHHIQNNIIKAREEVINTHGMTVVKINLPTNLEKSINVYILEIFPD